MRSPNVVLRRLAVICALAGTLCAPGVRAADVTYTYDAAGRVVSATFTNGVLITYTYDAEGNRTRQIINGPPIAQPVSATVAVNSTANTIPLNITGAPATSLSVSTPAGHGTATVVNKTSITYTPAANYAGPDSFQYKATNARGTSAPATVTITVQ